MATSQMSEVIQRLRRVLRDGAGPTDGQLLEDYISRRDEAAVAAIVCRHGPMVWGVCRRVLHNHHDAEDAFQATFLVLVRRAASIASRDLLANWLYGVAYQTALKARATAIKRKGRERQVANMPEPINRSQGAGIRSQVSGNRSQGAEVNEQEWLEVQGLLDQELSRLPDIYRGVFVLCDLEGKTRSEAARHCGLAEGTIASRLARARTMLAKRLAQRGVVLSGGTLALVLAQNVASAGVPASVVSATINAASLVAAGHLAAAGPVSVKAAALAEGVLKAMMIAKLKAVVAVVLLLGFLGTGATMLTSSLAMVQAKQPAAAVRPAQEPPKEEKEAFTAWGKEVGGLQAGLGFRPGEKRAYSHGETVKLVVRVRNVGKENVKFRYLKEFFMEKPPTVTGGEGKGIRQGGLDLFGRLVDIPVDVNLAPGKELELHDLKLKLAPASGSGDVTEVSPETLNGKGRFQIQYEQLAAASIDPNLTKLATGKLELEVKEAEKKEKEKETFTAWGKEINGLQAGLGFRPGEHRVYHHREGVAVVLRVRNVGKEAVEFNHIWAFFAANPPTITGADGKVIQLLPGYRALGLQAPRSANVAPGKEVELYEWSFDLRPQGESGNKGSLTIHGSGKFSLQCERIVGPTMANPNHPNPAMSKLATGKLELEVKEKEKEAFTAWGKEINGLQAGLGYRRGGKRAYHFGERVTLVARIRNVTKEPLEFQHIWAFFVENAPRVIDPAGKVVQRPRVSAEGLQQPRSTKVLPGKDVVLYEWEIELDQGWRTNHGPGTFHLQCERFVGPTRGNPVHPNPKLAKLATGKLDLEVKEPQKEPFTAWGKEVGGLQAGLGYPPGQARAYAPGETVKLVVRVRNVSKDEVKFRYSKESFFETPPSVTDGEGKPVKLERRRAQGFAALLQVTLAPGKEIELAEVKLEPRTATQSVHEGQWNLFTRGKFSVWYDQLEDPANDKSLSKIATGKLDLEIRFTTPPANDKQNIDPEKLYRTMEQTVRAAKSLHVALNSEVDSQAIRGTAKATICAAEGNKSRMEVDFELGGKADKLLFLTDGEAHYTKQGDKGTRDANPKKAAEQAKLVPVMIARIGITGAMLMARSVKPGEEKQFDLDKDAPVKDFKLGAKEMVGAKTAQVVTYQLVFDGTSANLSVWIDTKTHLPLKRVVSVDQAGQTFRVTETYSTFAIDPKLEPKLFEIPKE